MVAQTRKFSIMTYLIISLAIILCIAFQKEYIIEQCIETKHIIKDEEEPTVFKMIICIILIVVIVSAITVTPFIISYKLGRYLKEDLLNLEQ